MVRKSRVARVLLGPIVVCACAAACGSSTGAPPSAVEPAAVPAAPAAPVAPEAPAPVRFPDQNRPDVRGMHGAVSSDHPLATAAGYEVLRKGGTATDAIVAMAAVLTVVRPHMNGVGGDAFALFRDGESGEVTALDGSGRAGSLATREWLAANDLSRIRGTSGLAVTVPGAVAAWADALDRHGTMPLDELLEPAVRYARDGFPVTTRLRSDLRSGRSRMNEAARAVYLRDGDVPQAGELLRNPALANTLEAIGSKGPAGFYEGEVAAALASFVQSEGGALTVGDFAEHTSTWVEPLEVEYLGFRFHALPPSTQGVAQLQQIAMLKHFDTNEMGHNSSSYLHTLTEVRKRAFADRDRWVADPAGGVVPVREMLDPAYLERRAGEIDPSRADRGVRSGIEGSSADARLPSDRVPGEDDGDTVYLTAVDEWGNAVSWIQSVFSSMGSGLLEPSTGVLLHNRGSGFTMNPDSPNRLEPGKRPYHTLTPLLAVRPGVAVVPLGTPGGDGQTQFLVQVVQNLLVFGMTPQEAVEAPRIRGGGGTNLQVEARIPPEVRTELEARGHDLRIVQGWSATFGGAQLIWLDLETGTVTVGSDPRREAYGIAY